MKIASWNVNSIRARMHVVPQWVKENAPDVMLMQELKGEIFPSDTFEDLGYQSVAVTQKSYNGVAVLSRTPIEVDCSTLPGDEADSHARFLETRIDGLRIVNLYAPNGNPPHSDKFAYKLAWMDRLAEKMRGWLADGVPTLIGGDWNVIPTDMDCHKPSSWMKDALFQPEVKERYAKLLDTGWTDTWRWLHPDTKEFTYWDYFRLAFEHNRGIRIDHFLITPGVKERVQSCEIDRAPRALEKPSDHAPIVLTLR
jgi:exodeoxyribonuclease-3